MVFCIIKHLADTTEPMLDENQNVSRWLINLSELAAKFFVKYPQADLSGLLTYLVQKVQNDGTFILCYMLDQILTKMCKASLQHGKVSKGPKEALIQLFCNKDTNGSQKLGLRLMVCLAQ